MPRDRRDELGEASRAARRGEREGSYGQHGGDSHGVSRRTRSRSRSRSPRRRLPAAEDFYRERTPEARDGHGNGHRHGRHNWHHSRDVASRSPGPEDDEERNRHHHHHHRHHHRRHHRPKPTAQTTTASSARETPNELPSGARPLSYKHDLGAFTPLFAYYLDVQKNLDYYGLDAQVARGRWKSFANKWNRGELAEGWYDPELFERVTREAGPAAPPPPPPPPAAAARDNAARGAEREERGSPAASDGARGHTADDGGGQRRAVANGDGEDSDSEYGPPPPPPGQSGHAASGARKGPGIPTLSDLSLQRESAAEARESELHDLRLARKADRALQKDRLEELAPRAEPGTRERRLEKKAAVNEKMKGFREGAGDAVEEVGDGDLMGGGDSVAELRRAKAALQRKKTERELRREAEARAREEERLERLREWREREDEKLRGLKELARARFG